MSIDHFIIAVFCLIDDELKMLGTQKVRQSGPLPTLKDSEVITIALNLAMGNEPLQFEQLITY